MNWEQYSSSDEITGSHLGIEVASQLIGREVIESAIECVARCHPGWSSAESLLRVIASPDLVKIVASRLARETMGDIRASLADLLVELAWDLNNALDYAEILIASPDLHEYGIRLLSRAGNSANVSEVASRVGARITTEDLWSIYASLCGQSQR